LVEVEVIKIRVAAGFAGGEMEEGEAVAHEMGEGIAHAEFLAERNPGTGVEAVEKAGAIGLVVEVGFGAKVDVLGFGGQGDSFHDLGGTVRGKHENKELGVLLGVDAHISIVALEEGEAGVVAGFQSGRIEGC
jgi:hypothetical protein